MDALLTAKAELLATEIATQAKTLDDLNGLMKLMMKSALERMLDTEMDVHLGRKKLTVSTTDSAEDPGATVAAESPSDRSAKNRRNGHSSKTVSGELGEFTLDTPRDRQGTFEPQLIGKPTGIVRKVDGTPAAIWKAWCKGCQTRKARKEKGMAANSPHANGTHAMGRFFDGHGRRPWRPRTYLVSRINAIGCAGRADRSVQRSSCRLRDESLPAR